MGNHPNRFELEGNCTKIIYSTTSFSAVPQLNYQDQKRNLNFSGDEIRSLPTEIGTLISVTLEVIPDLRTITLSLLIPNVNLPEGKRKNPIETIAILTTASTSIGGPDLVDGQLEAYQILMLKGIASFVEF
jgi:hypothetical protein